MPFWKRRKFKIEDSQGKFKDDQVFCAMPWVHFHVAQNGNVTPCCQAPWGDEAKLGDINNSSILEIWKGKPFEDFRKKMLKGRAHEACSRCYEKEKMGWISLREITNEKYEKEIHELIKNQFKSSGYNNPAYFDIRFSNACNLKCRICNFSSSSSWFNDDLELGNINGDIPPLTTSIIDVNKFYTEFKGQLDSIKEIYFAGGEPLMMDQHYQLLEFLIDEGKSDCKLFYNTNLSRLNLKNRDVLDYWKEFEYVNLAVSLDDIGDRLEYQRKNIKWDQVKANFDRIKSEVPHVDLMISPTISLFNILSISEMHKSLVSESYVRAEDVVPTLLVNPQEFNIQVLSDELKQLAKDRIQNHLEWLLKCNVQDLRKMNYVIGQYKNILNYIDHVGSDAARYNLVDKIKKLDAIRNEDFAAVFPELSSMILV